MKHQELMDKILKEKLINHEVEPPSFVFERIQNELSDASPVIVPWYRKVAMQRIAAAVSLLMVSGAVYWLSLSDPQGVQVAKVANSADTAYRIALEERIRTLEKAAEESKFLSDVASVNQKNYPAMQPTSNGERHVVKSVSDLRTELNETTMNIETIPTREIASITGIAYTSNIATQRYQFSVTEVDYANSAPRPNGNSSASTLLNTFTKLSSGEYFALAKHKVNEFVTKEHYVNFAIGDVEFGQTIQLSK